MKFNSNKIAPVLASLHPSDKRTEAALSCLTTPEKDSSFMKYSTNLYFILLVNNLHLYRK